MLPISTLYELIQSLTKTEKRYFKLETDQWGGSKSYRQLYDLLSGFSSLGEKEQDLLKHRFSFHQLEIARKHLSKVLLRTLDRYQRGKDYETALWEKYTAARILLRKGFSEAALKLVRQGKKAAQNNKQTHSFALLSELELEIGVDQKFSDWTEEELIRAHTEIQQNEIQEEAQRKHASLYEIVLCRYWKNGVVRSQRQKAQLNDIMLEEHQIVMNHRQDTFTTQQLHLHFQSIYFRMTSDWENCLRSFHALDELFQNNPAEWMAKPTQYIRFLQDVLETLRCFEAFEEMDYFLSRLESLQQTNPPEKARVQLMMREHQLHRALAMGNFKTNTFDIPKISLQNDRVVRQDIIQWKFTLSRFHLSNKDFPTALKLINELLQIPESVLGKINYTKIRILNMMIHQALDHRDYLVYEIRSFERKMKKAEGWHNTEKLVVDYLRQWLAFKPWQNSDELLEQLLQNPYERVMVSELGLKSWLMKNSSK